MTYIELFLLSVGLCFDTFAVSISGGICLSDKPKWYQILKIILCFGIFQSVLTAVGWALGTGVSTYIERFDHWIAFLLLVYIGGKMIREGFSNEEVPASMNLLCTKKLCILSVATSIDALAVGISLAMIQIETARVTIGFGMILGVTALASFIGLKAGSAVGSSFGKRSEIAGGVILIGIGLKILLEHLL